MNFIELIINISAKEVAEGVSFKNKKTGLRPPPARM